MSGRSSGSSVGGETSLDRTPPPTWPGLRPVEPGAREEYALPSWALEPPRRRRFGPSAAIGVILVLAFAAGMAVDRAAYAGPVSPAPGVANGQASEPPQFKALW